MSEPYPLDSPGTPYDHQLMVVYSLYRVALSLILWALFLSGNELGQQMPALFLVVLGIYSAINIILLYVSVGEWKPGFWLLVAIISSDIIAIQLTLLSSGNTGTGLYTLMLASVAAGSLFLPARTFLVIPAIATISLLAGTVTSYSDQTDMIVFSGWMGALFFATGLLLHVLRMRIEQGSAATLQEQLRVKHLQQLNNLIIERMQTGILIVDIDGYILSHNRASQELLQIDRLTSATESRDVLLPAKHLTAIDNSLWHSLRAATTSSGDDASKVELQSRSTINYKGQTLQFTWLSLAGYDHSSTSEPATLVFVEDLAKIAQQAQQLKLSSLGKLTASIAHEIRNPLGAVSHAAQLLAGSNDNGKSSHEIENSSAHSSNNSSTHSSSNRLIEIIVKQSRRCSDVIDSVLNISRGHKAHIQQFELLPWLSDFLDDFSLANDGDIAVVGNYPQAVKFDPSQLSQVLTNLLTNALRHSALATGEKRATVIISRNNQLKPQIDICDDGTGVSSENREQLFEPFFSTVTMGNGLGLYLCRELCEANQATISYADWTADLPPQNLPQNAVYRRLKHSFRVQLSHPARKQQTIG